MRFDLERYVPLEVISGKKRTKYPIKITPRDDLILLEYTTTIHNATGPVGKRVYSHVLPRFISAAPDTFEVIGLLQGEMSKTVRQSLTFANSEPLIMERVVDWFEHEGFIERHRWHWYIKLNVPDASHHDPNYVEYITEYWCNRIGVDRAMRNPTPCSYVPNSTRQELSNNGTLLIEHGVPLLIQTVQSLVRQVTRTMPAYPHEAVVGYLRGIIAAEGCINYRMASHHRRIFIAAKDASERSIFIRCLDHLGIAAADHHKISSVIISRRKDLERVRALGLLDLHPVKKARFDEMLASYR